MSNKTDICNYALAEVAEGTITSLTENNEKARLCRLHLDQTVREVLRAAKWRCARKRGVLAQALPAPEFGWDYRYALPVDHVRLCSLNEIDPDRIDRPIHEVEGRFLLTDETVANIIYVYDVTIEGNYSVLDALVVKAIYLSLAAKLAWSLQQSRTLKELLEQAAEFAIRRAKGVNSREATEPLEDQSVGSRWMQARNS